MLLVMQGVKKPRVLEDLQGDGGPHAIRMEREARATFIRL